jgi:hypothetical protein
MLVTFLAISAAVGVSIVSIGVFLIAARFGPVYTSPMFGKDDSVKNA